MVLDNDAYTAHPIARVSVVERICLGLFVHEGRATFEMMGEDPVHHFLGTRDEVVAAILSDETICVVVDVIDVS